MKLILEGLERAGQHGDNHVAPVGGSAHRSVPRDALVGTGAAADRLPPGGTHATNRDGPARNAHDGQRSKR